MIALVQRVSSASVRVDGETVGEIGRGLLVLLGVVDGDRQHEADWLADKVVALRVFPDAEGKMNLSLKDVGGQALVVSQFTLAGDVRKGRGPATRARRGPRSRSRCTARSPPGWRTCSAGRYRPACSGRRWRWPSSTTGR